MNKRGIIGWMAIGFVIGIVVSIVGIVIYQQVSNYPNNREIEQLFGEQDECELRGGAWTSYQSRGSPSEGSFCNEATSDERNVCNSSSDCDSACKAPEGSNIGDEISGTCYGFVGTPSGMLQIEDGIVILGVQF